MAIHKALVVDDSRLARVALTKLLGKRGVEVDTAGSGGEAMDYLRETRPDVVFIDYMMPDMDGFEAAEAINRLPGVNGVPLVMYTSQDTAEDRQRAQELGICGFLLKPTSDEGLDKALEQASTWTAGSPPVEDSEVVSASAGDEVPEPVRAGPADAGPTSAPASGGESTPDLFPESPVVEPAGHSAPALVSRGGDRTEQRIREIASQVARDMLDSVRGEWQQQFHELAIDLQDGSGESASDASSDSMKKPRQQWDRSQRDAQRAAVAGAEKMARGLGDTVAREVAEQVAETTARRVASEILEETAADWGRGTGDNARGMESRVTAALQSTVAQLSADEAFQGQVVAVVSDQGVPVLKNALDQWVRQVAEEAAREAVHDAVRRGTDALAREAVVASAEAAVREVRKQGRRSMILAIAGWLVLAAGVALALFLAV